jgi:hypothetical protein
MIYISRPGDNLQNIILAQYGRENYAVNYERVIRANYLYLENYFPNITSVFFLEDFRAIELPDGSSEDSEVVQQLNAASPAQRATLQQMTQAGVDPMDMLHAVLAAMPSGEGLYDIADTFVDQTADVLKDSADKFNKAYKNINALLQEYNQLPGNLKGQIKPQLKAAYQELATAHRDRFFLLKRYQTSLPTLTTLRRSVSKAGFHGLHLKDAKKFLAMSQRSMLLQKGLSKIDWLEAAAETYEAYRKGDDWMREAFVDFGGIPLISRIAPVISRKLLASAVTRLVLGLFFIEGGWVVALVGFGVTVAVTYGIGRLLGSGWDGGKQILSKITNNLEKVHASSF